MRAELRKAEEAFEAERVAMGMRMEAELAAKTEAHTEALAAVRDSCAIEVAACEEQAAERLARSQHEMAEAQRAMVAAAVCADLPRLTARLTVCPTCVTWDRRINGATLTACAGR